MRVFTCFRGPSPRPPAPRRAQKGLKWLSRRLREASWSARRLQSRLEAAVRAPGGSPSRLGASFLSQGLSNRRGAAFLIAQWPHRQAPSSLFERPSGLFERPVAPRQAPSSLFERSSGLGGPKTRVFTCFYVKTHVFTCFYVKIRVFEAPSSLFERSSGLEGSKTRVFT